MTNTTKTLLLTALASAALLVPARLMALPTDSAANPAAPSVRPAAPPAGWSPISFAQPATTAPAPAPGTPAAVQQPPGGSQDHLLMAGDLLDVKVYQEPDLDSTLRVARDGAVVFPLIGRVGVGGLTPQEAAKVIRDALDKDYIINPQVSLRVTEYARRSYTVLGEVQKPGSYDMPDRASVSLLEAVGMAGGYTRVANASNVTVKRRVGKNETIFRLNAKKMAADGGPSASFEIKSDDVITVAESIF